MTEISIKKLPYIEFSELKNIITDINQKQQKNFEIEKAKEEGFKKGYEDGYKAFGECVEKIFEDLKRFDEELERLRKEYESKIIDVAIIIAEKIIKYEIEKDGYINFIKSHIEKIGNKKSKVVFPAKLKDLVLSFVKEKNSEIIERIEFAEDIDNGFYIKTDNFVREIEPFRQLQIIKEHFSK